MFKPEYVTLRFTPKKYNKGKKKFLEVLSEFFYKDKKDQLWVVPAGYQSDGGSIPKWAQGLIGEPLEGDTLRAVLVHDVYCDLKDRPQKEVHGVFREILKADGVNYFIRSAMHRAVSAYNRIKNPKWK